MIRGEGHNHPLWPSGWKMSREISANPVCGRIHWQRHFPARRCFQRILETRRDTDDRQRCPDWAHQRGIKSENGLYIPTPTNPVPDAYTGPTPAKSFICIPAWMKPESRNSVCFLKSTRPGTGTNSGPTTSIPDDEEYKTSCQPALVYFTP